MYSIFSSSNSYKINKPIPSALKPVGKAQGISISLEVLAAFAVCGFGTFLLYQHGLDISNNPVGYACVIVPVGFILSDYTIGSIIKGVKNHNEVERRKSTI